MFIHRSINPGPIFRDKNLSGKAIHATVKFNKKQHQWKKTKINGVLTRSVPDVGFPTPTDCLYIGELKDGKPTGYGTLTITPQSFAYTTYYSGEWKDGRYHGKGELKTVFSSHSHEYSGDFKDGLKHGYGRETWLGGSYEGMYENDERCGEAKSS